MYITDTGININHAKVEGRASWGTIPQNDADEEGNGNGTHCAGIIGSREYGVAQIVSRSWVPTELALWLMSLAVFFGPLSQLP